MSDTGVSPTAPAETPPAVLTEFDVAAAKVSEGLRALIPLMPAWEPKHPETEAFVKRFAAFSPSVISDVIAAVETNPELVKVDKFNVDKARRGLQCLTALRKTVDDAEEFFVNARFTYSVIKAREMFPALQMYEIIKGVGRDPSSAGVAAHAKLIKRSLRAKTRPIPAKKAPAHAPAEAPKPETPKPETPKPAN